MKPTMYPNDPLMTVRQNFTSFIWYLAYPLFYLFGNEITLFILQLVSYLLFLTGIYELTFELFRDKRAALLATISLSFIKISFAGILVYYSYFAPRFLTLAVLIWAIYFFIKEKFLWTILLSIVASNIHLIYALLIVAIFFIWLTLKINKIGLRYYIGLIGLTCIGLLPLFYWKSKYTIRGFSLNINYPWLDFVRETMPFFCQLPNFNPLNMDGMRNWLVVASLVVGVLIIRELKVENQQANLETTNKKLNLMNFFMIGLALIIVIVALIQEYIPITAIVQLQLIRTTIFITIFCAIIVAGYTSREWCKSKDKLFIYELLIYNYLGVYICIFINLIFKYLNIQQYKTVILIRVIMLIIICYVGIAAYSKYAPIYAGIHIYPKLNDMTNLQVWMKNNTSDNSTFITPVYLNEIENVSFRVISERSIIIANAEWGVVPLVEGYQDSVIERMDDLTNGAFSTALKGHNYDKIWGTIYYGYNSLNEQDIKKLHIKYNADYAIFEIEKRLAFPIVYQNNRFIVYHIID